MALVLVMLGAQWFDYVEDPLSIWLVVTYSVYALGWDVMMWQR